MNKTAIVIIAVVLLGAGLFYNFKLKEPAKSSWEIEYKVNCESCSVYYKNEEGKSIKQKHVEGSWDYSFTGNVDQFVYVSATPNKDGQKAKVTVIRDGKEASVDQTSKMVAPAKAGVTLFR